MTVAVCWGDQPPVGVTVTASCAICGTELRALLPDEKTAAHCAVYHRCATGVVGPVWTLCPPRHRWPS